MLRRLSILLAVGAALALVFSRAPAPARRVVALGGFGHGPTLVLVHGLGSGTEHWLPMARELAHDHRVVLVELPGHGVSEMPSSLSLDELADGLDRALDAEGPGPVTLVGHSIGGLVATAEALRAPGRVRALVLIETALRPQLEPADRAALLAALASDYRGTLRGAYTSFGRDSLQGEALFASAAKLDSAAMTTWIRLAVSADLSARTPELRMPVLAVLSDRSWPANEPWRACADTLGYAGIAALAPARVAGTGHFVMLDRPAQVAGLVRRFEREAATPVLALR